MTRPGLVILISGRGSNLRAILEAIQAGDIPADARAVISSNPDAPGLDVARTNNVTTEIVSHRAYPTRTAFDDVLRKTIDRHDPQLVLLAGFMRILGDDFIRHYQNRLLNIHPSLLPEFPGLHTHERALAAGAIRHGATVHFVTPALDTGPIVSQAVVSVLANDTAATLAERVLTQEHRIYPLAVKWFVEKRLSVRDGRVFLDGTVRPEQGLVEV